jgi:hypothetical protein
MRGYLNSRNTLDAGSSETAVKQKNPTASGGVLVAAADARQ